MIAAERARTEVSPASEAPPLHRARPSWPRRLSATLLAVTVFASLGGGGLVDLGSAYSLQGRAQALAARWASMVANGIPESDLASLRREWTQSQATRVLGAGITFWLPGGAATVERWESESTAIWTRDLSRYRADALTAEQALHDALVPETHVQRKSRLDSLAAATTPLDYSTLRDQWLAEARLVPVDKRIAAQVAALGGQVSTANNLGIRTEPAPDMLIRRSAWRTPRC